MLQRANHELNYDNNISNKCKIFYTPCSTPFISTLYFNFYDDSKSLDKLENHAQHFQHNEEMKLTYNMHKLLECQPLLCDVNRFTITLRRIGNHSLFILFTLESKSPFSGKNTVYELRLSSPLK